MSPTVALAAAAALSTSFLAGYGGGGGDGGSSTTSSILNSTTPTTTTTVPVGMTCGTEVQITPLQNMVGKGMCIDDASYFICPEKSLTKFPHTEEPIKYLRIFKAFRPEDSKESTNQARETFVRYVKANNIKVLVGSQITCDVTKDEEDWGWVKLLIQALGKDHVLALAVGNELDLLYTQKDYSSRECLERLWGTKGWPGYLYQKTVSRIKWARDTLDSPELPVTTVLTGSILYSTNPIFPDNQDVGLMTYLNHVFDSGEKHFVFVLNFYPIFDPNLRPDNFGTCDEPMRITACYDTQDCKTIYNARRGRELTNAFVRSNPAWGLGDTAEARLWLGEIGWSSPKPEMFYSPIATCDNFFSRFQLYSYYKNFLEWDMSLGDQGHTPPELVFYFTMRDAVNFGHAEHFGLVQDCSKPYCKVGPADTTPPKLLSNGTVV